MNIKQRLPYLKLNYPMYYYVIALVVLGAFLRFFNIGELPGPIFDEVYFPQYAYGYIKGEPFFHVHPPLYNYIATAGLWLYYQIPFIGLTPISGLSFEQLDPIGYRWINALFGTALIPTIIYTLFYFTGNKKFALLAGFFIAIDGSIVVDSRFGLNNIFLLLFGFLACLYLVKSHLLDYNSKNSKDIKQRKYWLLLAGLYFGCLLSIKWNGLSYWLAVIALFIGVILFNTIERYRPSPAYKNNNLYVQSIELPFSGWFYLLALLLIPVSVYCLLWIPDRLFNTQFSFVEIHQQIMTYHQSVVGSDRHPYCSKWYNWPWMERPISYYFSSRNVVEQGLNISYYKDVHLFGNPALYWLSATAVGVMLFHWFYLLFQWFKQGVDSISGNKWLVLTAILLGYFANYISWALVPRCVFFYHYQSASAFAFIALSWYLALAFNSSNTYIKWIAGLCIFLIVAAFIFWLPFMLGIEISSSAYYLRMWFPSWI